MVACAFAADVVFVDFCAAAVFAAVVSPPVVTGVLESPTTRFVVPLPDAAVELFATTTGPEATGCCVVTTGAAPLVVPVVCNRTISSYVPVAVGFAVAPFVLLASSIAIPTAVVWPLVFVVTVFAKAANAVGNLSTGCKLLPVTL